MDTIQKVKVRNMTSSKGYGTVPNQFLIITGEGTYFQSYESVIAFIPFRSDATVLLDATYWDYSNTTGKYRNAFLGEDKKATEKKIADGTYQLADLNG